MDTRWTRIKYENGCIQAAWPYAYTGAWLVFVLRLCYCLMAFSTIQRPREIWLDCPMNPTLELPLSTYVHIALLVRTSASDFLFHLC